MLPTWKIMSLTILQSIDLSASCFPNFIHLIFLLLLMGNIIQRFLHIFLLVGDYLNVGQAAPLNIYLIRLIILLKIEWAQIFSNEIKISCISVYMQTQEYKNALGGLHSYN